MQDMRTRLEDLWRSGFAGKSVLIIVPALAASCCCVTAGLGLGLITAPPAAPPVTTMTPTVTETYGPVTATELLTETEAPDLTDTPTGTATLTPTATVSNTPVPTRTPRPTATINTTPPTETPVGFSVLLLTSPIARGQNATLEIETVAKSTCNLVYITPQGSTSGASGLGLTTADKSGVCLWSWQIAPTDKRGIGKLIISAGGVTRNQNIRIS